MLSHRASGRAQCTQGGKLVFYWFYKGFLAELPVLVRFLSASRVGAVLFGQAVLAEILHFTNVLKVFGQPCWCGFFWPGRFGWNRLFYQRF